MSVTSSRTTQIAFSGDVESSLIFSAADNPLSVSEVQIVDLASGDNTITVPVSSGLVATAVTIIPPSANTIQLVLKGVDGDTGIDLHLTDHLTISLKSTVTSFVLNAADVLVGLRLIWS